MQHKNSKLRLLIRIDFAPGLLDILLQLADRILEGSTGIINLVHNQDSATDEVRHLAQCTHVKPLGAGDFGTSLFDVLVARVGQLFIQRQTDSLDGDVWAARLLKEGPQDARGDVTAASDCNHQVRLEVVEDLGRSLLAQLVHLVEV